MTLSESVLASSIIITGLILGALVYYLIDEYWFNRPASEERIRKFKKNPQLHKRITEHLEPVFVKQVVRFLKLLILCFSLTPRMLLMGLTKPFQPVANSVWNGFSNVQGGLL